jgi:hypothetical protein
MQEDFHESLGDTLSSSATAIQSSRRCYLGIGFSLDPITKRKVSKLQQEHQVTLLWMDVYEVIKQLMEQEIPTLPQE